MKTQQTKSFSYFSLEKSLFNILESISEGFIFVNTEWTIIYWNKSAERLLGLTPEEVVGKNLWEKFPDTRQSIFYEQYLLAKETLQPVAFEAYFDSKDIWVDVKANPTAEGMAIFFQDVTRKIKLSAEVAIQRNQHRAIINTFSDAIWSVDRNYCLLAANEVFRKNAFRYSGKELNISDCVLELMSAEEGAKWKPYYDRALAGDSFSDEMLLSYLTPEGMVYTEISFNAIKDEDTGFVYGVACFAKDITVSKRHINLIEDKNHKLQKQEEKLMALTNKLEAILDNSPDMIATVDAEGRYVSVNQSSLYILGIDPKEMTGRHFAEFVHPDDVDKTNKIAADILSGVDLTDFSNRLIKADGYPIHMMWSARWDEKQQLMFCIARDATALHHAQLEKFESEQRFAALIDKGADMIGIIDINGTYKFASSNVKRILGYEADELVGVNAFDLIHPDDIEKVGHDFNEVLLNNEQRIKDFRFKNSNGDWRWIEVICTNMLENDVIKGLIINSRDITERKESQQKLTEAFESLSKQNTALKEISFIQSHEVRKPLANILGLTHLILEHQISDELTCTIQHLKQSSEELDAMIKRIVTTSYDVTQHIL